MAEETIKFRRRAKLSDQLIQDVINDCIAKELTTKQIARKHKISTATVYYIKRDNNLLTSVRNNTSTASVIKTKKRNVVIVTEKETSMEVAAEKIKPPFDEFSKMFSLDRFDLSGLSFPVINAGLVADRHDMPVDKYIFESISDETMFAFDKLEDICKSFIAENFHFDKNGNSVETLAVYVTGLQSALGAVVKACFDMHIKLKLMHYCAISKMYKEQNISSKENALFNILWSVDRKINLHGVYFYNSSEEDYNTESSDCYSIVCSSVESTFPERSIVLCKSYMDAVRIYALIVGFIQEADKKLSVMLNQSSFHSCNFSYGHTMMKGYN